MKQSFPKTQWMKARDAELEALRESIEIAQAREQGDQGLSTGTKVVLFLAGLVIAVVLKGMLGV